MSTLEERAPLTFHTPTERDAIVDLLAKAERLSAELADAYREAQRIVTGTSPLVAVDLGDPLAMFRLPSGQVGYETTYADHVVVGDWVQACHGDAGQWSEVTGLSTTSDRTIGVELNHTALRWWAPTDAIRVARPPADVIDGQDRGL